MASTADYLAAIKQVYPNIQQDQGLTDELSRRAAEGASTDQVLNDAGGYYQVGQGNRQAAEQQASAQVDPAYNATVDSLNSQKTDAQAQSDKLQASIAKAYQQRRENDGLAKQGIASGAAQDYVTGQQVGEIKSASDDLTSKLSTIAQSLRTASAGAAQQKSALVQSNLAGFEDKTNQTLQQRLQNAIAQQQAAQVQQQQESDNSFRERQFAADNEYRQAQLAIDRQKASSSANPGLTLTPDIIAALRGDSPAGSQAAAVKLTPDQAAQELKDNFSKDYASSAGNDQGIIQNIQTETGLSADDAAKLFYETRKPFEPAQVSTSAGRTIPITGQVVPYGPVVRS